MIYLPKKNQDLRNWATNFSTLISASPTQYGLTAGQATTFATFRTAFTNSLALATNNATRTKSTVAAMNAAKANLLVNARLLAAIVQAFPTVTNQDRQDLGLTVRNTSPTPIGAPTTKPIVTLLNTAGGLINFRFADETTPASRAKPFGAVALQLYAKIGPVAPVSIDDCTFKGNYTKNSEGPGSAQISVGFSGADAGKTAYILSRWVNRRGEVGPVSTLTSMTIAA